MNEKSSDKLLLRLHRQYSKDETVGLQKQKIEQLEKELSKANFKLGENKSEIAELEDKIKKLDEHLNEQIMNNENIRKSQSDFDKMLNKRTKDLKEKVKRLQANVRFWQDKYYSVTSKK